MESDERLRSELADNTRFTDLVHVGSCESTQDLAVALRQDAIVWADEQTGGRGRRGRDWHGSPGDDVELTFRLEKLRVHNPAVVATAAPMAFLRAIEGELGERLHYKWPNDILCRARKLSGILIDAVGNPPASYLVGIGTNVNRTSFPPELRDVATSLALVSGRHFARHDLVRALATSLSDAVERLERDGDDPELAALLSDRLGLAGRTVQIEGAGLDVTTRLEDIDLTHATLGDGRRVELARVTRLGRAR